MGSECIINVGLGYWYPQGTDRLVDSLGDVGYEGGILTWRDTLPEGSPTHEENPYAMKIFAFKAAMEKGNSRILWLDSSVWALKKPDDHFKRIEEDGYYFFHSGFNCAQWTNDNCLNYFGITREEAEEIPMLAGGILGLNMDHEIARTFFILWERAMLAGAFKGVWQTTETEHAHRHDQSCASIIAYRLGMKIHPQDVNEMFWREDMPQTAEFTLQGM